MARENGNIPIGPIYMGRTCRGMVHVIEDGDTLYNLGKKYHVSVTQLMFANPYVNVYNLQIGDELCIPARMQPRNDRSSGNDMQPRNDMSSQNDIQSRNDMPSRNDMRTREEMREREDMRGRVDMPSRNDMRTREEMREREDMRTRENMQPDRYTGEE